MRDLAKQRLMATYPRLMTDSDTREILKHISSTETISYWQDRGGMESRIFYPAAHAIQTLREECLDTYVFIQAEVENEDDEVLLAAARAIRLRLRALEPKLANYGLQYSKFESR